MVRTFACEARGPGFDSSFSNWFSFLSSGDQEVGKRDPDTINCVILRILVDKK